MIPVDELESVYDSSDYRELIPADRCDRCGARALIRAHRHDGELLFCGHHGEKHFEALTDQGYMYQDETSRILAEG